MKFHILIVVFVATLFQCIVDSQYNYQEMINFNKELEEQDSTQQLNNLFGEEIQGHCDVGYYSCTGTRRCCPDGYDCTGTDKCEKGYCDVGYYSCTGTRWCCPDGYDCTGTDQCDEKRGYLFWLLIGAPILVFAIAGSIVICYRGYRDRPRKTDLPSTACSGFLQSNISSSRGRLIEQ